MMNHRQILLGLLALGAMVLVIGTQAWARTTVAQSGGPYDLSWNTLNTGVTFSSGGPYVLGGTGGQADAGLLTGGDYTLDGGFWSGGALAGNYRVYLPLVLRNGS